MAGVRCKDETKSQQVAAEVLEAISCSARAIPLDDILLPNREPYLQMRDWMREGIARPTEQSGFSDEGLWHGQHRRQWKEVPPRVAEEVAASVAANPWLCALTARERDLLLLTLSRLRMSR